MEYMYVVMKRARIRATSGSDHVTRAEFSNSRKSFLSCSAGLVGIPLRVSVSNAAIHTWKEF
jgi:hypothetical protein